MNIQIFNELNKTMKARLEYIDKGDDGRVWFGVVDKIDKKIEKLIKLKNK